MYRIYPKRRIPNPINRSENLRTPILKETACALDPAFCTCIHLDAQRLLCSTVQLRCCAAAAFIKIDAYVRTVYNLSRRFVLLLDYSARTADKCTDGTIQWNRKIGIKQLDDPPTISSQCIPRHANPYINSICTILF